MPPHSSHKYAIFLDGPIGVGKTTLGQALAQRCSAAFLDGDDFSGSGKPWYASSLSTNQRILKTSLAAIEATPLVFIAYPIRCVNWVFFNRRFEDAGIETLYVGLQASIDSISGKTRCRVLSPSETARSQQMIEQGYGARPFTDFVVRTDDEEVAQSVERTATYLKASGVTF